MVEHPGPWAAQALQSPGITVRDAAAISRSTRDSGTRAVLVRRFGREGAAGRTPDARRTWRLVDVVRRRQVTGTWSEHDGLAPAIAAMDRWPTEDEPASAAVLVCTHGVHDACCAIWGRPVMIAMLGGPEDVWECSHLGGDRFAANLVALPEGACYGGTDATNVVNVVAAHRSRATPTEHLRGISSEPGPVQAALAAALERYGPAGVDDVRGVALRPLQQDRWEVTLEGLGSVPRQLTAAVHRTWEEGAPLTCGAVRATSPFRFQVDLVEA